MLLPGLVLEPDEEIAQLACCRGEGEAAARFFILGELRPDPALRTVFIAALLDVPPVVQDGVGLFIPRDVPGGDNLVLPGLDLLLHAQGHPVFAHQAVEVKAAENRRCQAVVGILHKHRQLL